MSWRAPPGATRPSSARESAPGARGWGSRGVAAALALAVLFPGALDRARDQGGTQPFRSTSARVTYVPNACDQPRGATFTAARPCATPGATDVAALDRRYARQ